MSLSGELDYLLSTLKVIISGKRETSKNILKEVHNKYKGKRCFVIGNGPSLTAKDLDLLKDEVTFASNRIYKIFKDTDWRPTYFVMMDDGVAASEGVIENVNKLDCIKFVREQGYNYAYKYMTGDVCYVHTWYDKKYLDAPMFSDNLIEGLYTIGTVTYAMIQIARWMGFDTIYLLGLDNRYAYTISRDGSIVKNEGVVSYFQANGEKAPDESMAVEIWQMDVAYECARKYSKANNFKIYNATRGGFLEIFERVNIDSVI